MEDVQMLLSQRNHFYHARALFSLGIPDFMHCLSNSSSSDSELQSELRELLRLQSRYILSSEKDSVLKSLTDADGERMGVSSVLYVQVTSGKSWTQYWYFFWKLSLDGSDILFGWFPGFEYIFGWVPGFENVDGWFPRLVYIVSWFPEVENVVGWFPRFEDT